MFATAGNGPKEKLCAVAIQSAYLKSFIMSVYAFLIPSQASGTVPTADCFLNFRPRNVKRHQSRPFQRTKTVLML